MPVFLYTRRPNDLGKSWRTFNGTTCPAAGGVATRFQVAVIDSIHKPDNRFLRAIKSHVVLQDMI
jgi:hypothetical protein